MKKFLKTVSAFLVALSMAAMPVTAQADHNGGRQSHFSSGQSSNGSGHKPRPSGGNNGSGQRPGGNNPGSNNGHRPGGNNPGSSNGHRPGGSNPGSSNGHRPGNNPGSNNGHRPGGNNPGSNNGHRPGGNPGRPTPPPPPPSRPNRPAYFGGHHSHHVPFFGSYHRPVPPPGWRPATYGPSFGTILGITFGATVDLSVRALLNSGYNVTGYGNDVVYLTNVPQMNYYWPDAALYYTNGALCGSSYTYPSAYCDMSRYNALYNTFCGQYGVPASSVNQGGVISSTWFGSGNRFVTLEFNSNYGNYYTTLSFGM